MRVRPAPANAERGRRRARRSTTTLAGFPAIVQGDILSVEAMPIARRLNGRPSRARYPWPMALLTIRDAELAFGLHPLLDRADFTLDANERVGLIGRNGTGKSSLLLAIAGRQPLDDGIVEHSDGLRIVLVEQEPLLPPAS